MIYSHEILTIIIGTGVLILVIFQLPNLKKHSFSLYLLWAFLFFMVSRFATILEVFVFEDFFNYLEHCSYTAFAVFMLLWAIKRTGREGT